MSSPAPLFSTPTAPATDEEWAQNELSKYFRAHPELLRRHLDRMMASLRGSTGGDMGPFIVEMDLLITEVNAAIDAERRDAPPRAPPSAGGRMMRDFPDCTNDFLHHFLDGVLEAVEKERASGGGGGRGRAISAGGVHLGGSGRATPTGERRRFASASVHK